VSVAAGAEQTASSEIRRFTDPATEFPVLRLTNPAHSAWLPALNQSAAGRHGNLLLYVSDRSGSMQAWRMDAHSGESRRISQAEALDRTSVTLTPDQRAIAYLDGRSVTLQPVNSGRTRVAYRVPDTHDPAGAFALSHDGALCTVAEQAGGRYRLRLVRFAGNTAQTLFETGEALTDVAMRPTDSDVMYRSGGSFWLASLNGGKAKKLPLSGEIGPAYWSRDGRSILYLNTAESQIRQLEPETGNDVLVARTSRYVTFAPNLNQSVFVGVSGSKVSPYVMILLRTARRELALCEHRAKDAATANPVFSFNTQQLFFAGDAEGRPTVYSVRLERLLENTDEEAGS